MTNEAFEIVGRDAPIGERFDFDLNSHFSRLFYDFDKNYSVYVVSVGRFSLIHLIEYFLELIGPAHGLFSAWTASGRSMRQVLRFFENRDLLSVRFLLDRTFPNTRPALYQYLIDQFGADSVRTLRSHLKIYALFNAEYSVIIESSANLNKNLRLESYRVTESVSFREFFQSVFDIVFEKTPLKRTAKRASESPVRELRKLSDGTVDNVPGYVNVELIDV